MPKTRLPKKYASLELAIGLALLFSLSGLIASAAVVFTDFRAAKLTDGSGWIKVEWVTAYERNTRAFNLYRSTSIDGPWDEAHLITQVRASGNDLTGAQYEYLDKSWAAGVCHYYLVGEVTSSGSIGSTDGPVSAGDNCSAATATATPTPTATATATPTTAAGGPPPATATATATATKTAKPDVAKPTATLRFTNTPAPPPTATRQFANTPAPPSTATPGPGATQTRADVATATPLSDAQVMTPTAVAGSTQGQTPPAATPRPGEPAAATPRPGEPAATATDPAPRESIEPAEPLAATSTPQIFAAATTGSAVLEATPRATLQPASQANTGRNNRLFLLVGGGAIALAGLLGVAGLLIWRASRPR